jgi:hypothetical protein
MNRAMYYGLEYAHARQHAAPISVVRADREDARELDAVAVATLISAVRTLQEKVREQGRQIKELQYRMPV